MFRNELKQETIDILLKLKYLPVKYNVKKNKIKKIKAIYGKFLITIKKIKITKNYPYRTLVKIKFKDSLKDKDVHVEYSFYMCEIDINKFEINSTQEGLIYFDYHK